MAMRSAQPGYRVGGRYRLVTLLGSGGFGRVWRAHDEVLDVEVAIKELQLLPGMSQAEQDKRLERAAREARNAVRLRSHENILAIYDVVSDGLPWIVMELIDGSSLAEHLDEHGPLPVEQATRVAGALLAALGAAHRAGIVHRDVKPANVMLSTDGRVLLTDFGIALHTTDTTLTTTGMLIGSPEYMAPERLRGTDELPAGDLFSLGATLYQAVEGVSPFRRDTQPAALTAVLLEEPPPPRRAGPLAPLITRLLDKDPGNRPTVEQGLAMLGERQPSGDRTRILPPEEAPERAWQPKGVAAMMAIILALGVLGLMKELDVLGFRRLRSPWDYIGDIVSHHAFWGVALAALLIIEHGLVGLLCARMARLLRPLAGETVAVIGGAAGFVAGAAAVFYAFDGMAVLLATLGIRSGDRIWVIPLIVITTVMVLLGGWAWESRKPRRLPAPASQTSLE
ncbi:serine/threonine-protein kinase [Nonomuraea wenchangensis]|uniref:non-specific serine/threonine protein kinase n=1 Tax=Nonomuraea wenchangensis TaxID=568860 RepID=A0A1I0LB34_9ACTN|nr:serine/threonine-protein kinase [Nonomuraea wenchangensis]SEU37197.1 Serine/threonine protein kinase [Nonomuraea wenchangensis]